MDALTPARIAARLRGAAPQAEPPPRPEGRVIWVHAPDGIAAAPLIALADRLSVRLGRVRVLVLVTGGPPVLDTRLIHQPLPPDTPRSAARFLAHWRPDVALWIGDTHAPLLLDGAARAGVPLILANATSPPIESPRARRVRRLLLGHFSHVLARDAAAGTALRAIAGARTPIAVTGPLTQLSRPLRCADSDREEFASVLTVRPVWLAVAPPAAEMPAVLAAHRVALKEAHRMLLLLFPDICEQGAELAQTLRTEGWLVSRRGADELPARGDEIYVADSVEDLGLWYRLAPVCYVGGTLTTGARRDPMEAAALGAAIIAGQQGGDLAANLRRLDSAGALRRIDGADQLGRAVTDLMAPDRAAQLAHRAWDVATEGADVEERLALMIAEAVGD